MGAKGGITGRGTAWELLNSWWIAFSLVSLCFIGFFIIGSKAKQKKWTVMGLIFLILQLGSLLAAASAKGILEEIFMTLWFSVFIAGIILSFRARKEYLMCRDVLLNARFDEREKQNLRDAVVMNYERQGIVKAQTAESFSPGGGATASAAAETVELRQYSQQRDGNAVLDINSCSESDFTGLPGVSVVTAKKAVGYREEHGGFKSTEEFFTALAIKPHFMVQMNSRITCGEYSPSTQAPARPHQSGRKLDF